MDPTSLWDTPFHGHKNSWMQVFPDRELDNYFPDYCTDPEIIGDEIEEILWDF